MRPTWPTVLRKLGFTPGSKSGCSFNLTIHFHLNNVCRKQNVRVARKLKDLSFYGEISSCTHALTRSRTSLYIYAFLQVTSLPRFNSNTSTLPLNHELNPVCHLLALLGAHHILHVFRIRVKLRLFRKSKKI